MPFQINHSLSARPQHRVRAIVYQPHVHFKSVYRVSLIVFLIGFNILIIVHELGHYLAARAFGMRATCFSIGFGPAIVRFHGKETIFQFALIPFGGYVQLEGLTGKQTRGVGAAGDSTGPNFQRFAAWKRAIVILAGPLANLLLAVGVYSYLFGTHQAVTFDWKHQGTNVVREASGSSKKAGMRPYDVIESINGHPVRTFGEFARVIGATGANNFGIDCPLTRGWRRFPTSYRTGKCLFCLPDVSAHWRIV